MNNFLMFRQQIQEKQKIFHRNSSSEEFFKIKEEPEIAEILLAQNPSDPFGNECFIKEEEFPQDEEMKFEPEVKIYEAEPTRNLRNASESLKKPDIKVASIKPRRAKRKASTALCLDCGIHLPPQGLIQHRLDAHKSQFVCDVCSRTYRTKNSLLKHIRHHIVDDSKYKCEPCAKIFVNSKELIAHKNRCHSNGSSFICDHCEDVFATRKEMLRCRDGHYVRKKAASEGTRTCPICHKTMKSNSVYSHIRLVHNNERDQICQVKNFKIFLNPRNLIFELFQICGKALKTSYDLKVHLRKHSGERPEICEHCGKTFISYAQLYKHRKVRHMERENFQCSICLKNVLSRFKLKCHVDRFHPNGVDNGMRVDADTNCYHCKICPLKFVAMHKYEKHLKLNDCHKYDGLTMQDPKMSLKGDLKGEFKCQECGR